MISGRQTGKYVEVTRIYPVDTYEFDIIEDLVTYSDKLYSEDVMKNIHHALTYCTLAILNQKYSFKLKLNSMACIKYKVIDTTTIVKGKLVDVIVDNKKAQLVLLRNGENVYINVEDIIS